MALVVLKFGGTSLGTPARIRRAARRVRWHTRAGDRVVVVVSATGNTTDRILRWLRAVSPTSVDRPSREYARALASGEDLSATLLSAALSSVGVEAVSLRGGEAGLLATGSFAAGSLHELDTTTLRDILDNNQVPVISGFQAVDAAGHTLTLGRGGSDATAVFVAGKLAADVCHIITDVHAVCDADPNIKPDAVPLPSLTHGALVRITEAGGEVVQPAAARFAQHFNTPLRVYHYSAPFNPDVGTSIGSVTKTRSRVSSFPRSIVSAGAS